eukprot:364382-Chlamydomonas_euryale.AAC.4
MREYGSSNSFRGKGQHRWANTVAATVLEERGNTDGRIPNVMQRRDSRTCGKGGSSLQLWKAA